MAFTDVINTTKRFKLGTRKQVDSKEFIYLQGIGSTIVGSWASFDGSYLTALTVAATRGAVAVAMAATVASTFGWYQIYGVAIGNVVTGAANAAVWVTATPGKVDNTDVALQVVIGAVQRSATASNLASFALNYPFVEQIVVD